MDNHHAAGFGLIGNAGAPLALAAIEQRYGITIFPAHDTTQIVVLILRCRNGTALFQVIVDKQPDASAVIVHG